MSEHEILAYNGEPLERLFKKFKRGGFRFYVCSVCGSVYYRRGDARICCGELKHKAGIAYWWPARKVYKPRGKPLGRLDVNGDYVGSVI